MLPEDQRTPGRVVDVVIEIDFKLQPTGQTAEDFHSRAKIIHSERLAQDEFHIGVQFIGMDDAALQVLRAWIDEHA